jgi:hypothetical protein
MVTPGVPPANAGSLAKRDGKGTAVAQRVRVLLTCDVHGDETPGDETVIFSVDGVGYEMDVCATHAARFRETLGEYIGVARRASGGRGRRGGRRSRGSGGDRAYTAEVRAWAREQGLPVSERGRIPASLLEQYQSAH